jgi:hypothetical protein
MSKSSERTILALALFFSLIFMPWWFSALLMCFGLLFFQPYYEALIAAFILDTLYGSPDGSFLESFPVTLFACFLFLLSFWVREYVRLDPRV